MPKIGIKTGVEKATKEFVLGSLRNGLSLDLISNITNLPLKTIQQIQAEANSVQPS